MIRKRTKNYIAKTMESLDVLTDMITSNFKDDPYCPQYEWCLLQVSNAKLCLENMLAFNEEE